MVGFNWGLIVSRVEAEGGEEEEEGGEEVTGEGEGELIIIASF